MPSIDEGDLTFEFPEDWDIVKLDGWSFYRNQFQSVCSGTKAVDLLAIEPGHTCVWFIEIKDYRRHVRTKRVHVADEIACKVRDSLALLATARVKANDAGERAQAQRALQCREIKVILHLEQPTRHSKLFPRKIDLANTQQKLRQLVRAIDPHARVSDTNFMSGCQWTVH